MPAEQKISTAQKREIFNFKQVSFHERVNLQKNSAVVVVVVVTVVVVVLVVYSSSSGDNTMQSTDIEL